MTEYDYVHANTDATKLQQEIAAAGQPVSYINVSGNFVAVFMSRDLTTSEKTALDNLVAAHDGRPRRRRLLYDVFNDVGNLTAAQKQATANDLFGGTPPKFTQDQGQDSASLLVLYCLSQTGLSTADKNLVKQAAAAVYCRDNPKYLVNQTFGGTVPAINVSGDEVIPQ